MLGLLRGQRLLIKEVVGGQPVESFGTYLGLDEVPADLAPQEGGRLVAKFRLEDETRVWACRYETDYINGRNGRPGTNVIVVERGVRRPPADKPVMLAPTILPAGEEGLVDIAMPAGMDIGDLPTDPVLPDPDVLKPGPLVGGVYQTDYGPMTPAQKNAWEEHHRFDPTTKAQPAICPLISPPDSFLFPKGQDDPADKAETGATDAPSPDAGTSSDSSSSSSDSGSDSGSGGGE